MNKQTDNKKNTTQVAAGLSNISVQDLGIEVTSETAVSYAI